MTVIDNNRSRTVRTDNRSSTTTTSTVATGETVTSSGTVAADGIDRDAHGNLVEADRAGESAPAGRSYNLLGFLGRGRASEETASDRLHRIVDETTATGTRELRGGPHPPPPTTASSREVKLGSDGSGDLYLSPAGHFVGSAGQEAPANPLQAGEALFRAAQLSENDTNLFARDGISLDQKRAALTALTAASDGAAAEDFGRAGYQTKEQAQQVRASAAPLILDLAKSCDPSKPDQKALRDEAVSQYLRLLGTEPNGANRNFMIYDLDRAKTAMPEVRPVADRLMNEVAPLKPPYDSWFKDGNKKVRVDYHVGDGFWDEERNYYKSQGFTQKDNRDGTSTLSKTFVDEKRLPNGRTERVETPVELVMHNGTSDMFKKMDDPGVQMVVYSGHANYGREVPSHVADGTPMRGDKVFAGFQCGGKGTQNAIADRYPDMQHVQSKNSSYGYQDRQTMMNMLEGISRRESWASMSKTNQDNNSSNYYFPSDTYINKRALDRDHDGKVDDLDRVVNYNHFRPDAPIETQLTPTDPGKPADQLDGQPLHNSVLRFHRMAGYNSWLHDYKDQKVLNDGYFDGGATDPLYRLQKEQRSDGAEIYRLQVNKQYAHANEEVLGAALHYELGRKFAAEQGLDDKDAKLAGLAMATKALDVDNGASESAAFKTLLKYAGLPKDIDYYDMITACHSDSDNDAGSPQVLAKMKETLRDKHIDW